ncbi:hypothetical protein SY88_12130 [Clostridiales bacterium PH28_bin88]|nr:hypothetical protein SY88_12130 [Clostridiales bacterium PH28_bin88]
MGFIFSLSGAGSVIGNMQRDAVTLAINQINEQGGVVVNGKKHLIRGVFRDDESKPDVGARRMRELARDGIKIVQGGTLANVALAMSEASKEEGVLFMAACAVPSPFFNKSTKAPYSLAILGNAVSVGRSGATYALKEYNPKKLVFFLPDYAWGQMHEEGARQVLANRPDIDFQVVYSPVGTADLTPYIIKVRDMNPDLVVLGHWGADAITALKQVHEMGLQEKTKVMFIWMISVFATAVEPESIDGMKALTFWHHDMEGFRDQTIVDASNKLVKEWVASIGQPPDAYAMAAWLGVKEMVRGIELAKNLEPSDVYNALMKNPDFESPKGPAKWRIDGTPMYKYWAFVLEGKGAGERRDPKWDFGKVLDGYESEEFLVPLKLLGWE